ncbi:hypothetical protein ACFWOJ_23330 [Streptomyces sp. NPDC058439]|uniref:hypothetical protein n=1 Tax=Streptomyces sp. NPDC058439 TaxID=3346500 RepID=UPI003665BDE9
MSLHLRLNFIDGQRVPAESVQVRKTINPADFADVIGEFTESGGVDADRAVDAAAAALPSWRGRSAPTAPPSGRPGTWRPHSHGTRRIV